MTKFELIQEYYQLRNQVKAASSRADNSWGPLYHKWRMVGQKLLDEMGKVKMRENETYEQYTERRRRLRETVFG
jgi:hypothetical protein